MYRLFCLIKHFATDFELVPFIAGRIKKAALKN